MSMDQVKSEYAPLGDVGFQREESEASILAQLAEEGYTGTLVPLEGSRFRCEQCGSVCDGSALHLTKLRRLEGASDPDDMVAIAALVCPVCGEKGVLVLGYGPTASTEDADLLAAASNHREELGRTPE